VVSPNLNQLKPQESTNYQLGFVYHGPRVSLDGDVYYINFKNKLQTAFNASTGETDQFNLGGAIYKGIEGQVSLAATDNVSVFANGSINLARTIGEPTLGVIGNKQIASSPLSTAGLGAVFHTDEWTVSLLDKYIGKQWGAEGQPTAYLIPG